MIMYVSPMYNIIARLKLCMSIFQTQHSLNVHNLLGLIKHRITEVLFNIKKHICFQGLIKCQ